MDNLKIAIGSDHGGFEYKTKIVEFLDSKGISYKDMGCYTKESVDYPEVARAVCEQILQGKADRGILICGSGIGMSIAANKVHGIRAALCAETYSARVSREHNDANVLCLGERVIGENVALDVVDIWLKTEFDGGRHKRRVDMLE